MSIRWNGSLILSAVIASAVVLYGINVVSKRDSYISTNGLSTKIVESDLGKLRICITNEANALKDIEAKRATDKQVVMNILKANGITESNIIRSDVSISDNFRWTEKIEGKKKYEVSDYIYLKSDNVQLIKKVCDSLNSECSDKGIVVNPEATYVYKNLDKLRISMIEEATQDSRNRADHIAAISKVKIVGLRNLSTGKFAIAAEDSSPTADYDYQEEQSINKRIRVVVHGSFNIK